MALLAVLAPVSLAAQPAGYKPYAGKSPIVVSADPAAKTANLEIIGSDGLGALGFNFNGYANGDLIVEVPEGWTVNVTFTVDSVFHHSLAIVPWAQHKAHAFTDAFAGSSVPHPKQGISRGDKPSSFSFVASKAGKYAMVCEVHGHDELGMWDRFDVVSGLSAPAAYVK